MRVVVERGFHDHPRIGADFGEASFGDQPRAENVAFCVQRDRVEAFVAPSGEE